MGLGVGTTPVLLGSGACGLPLGADAAPAAVQVPLSEEEQREKSSKPEKMAIGGEGGFQVASAAATRARRLSS